MTRTRKEPDVVIIDDDDDDDDGEAEKSSRDKSHPTHECLAIPGTSRWYPTAPAAQSSTPTASGVKRQAYLSKRRLKRRRLHDRTKKRCSEIASASIPVNSVSSESSISRINKTSNKLIVKSDMRIYKKLLNFIKNHPEIIINPAVAEIGETLRSQIESYTSEIIHGLLCPEEELHSDIEGVVDLTQLSYTTEIVDGILCPEEESHSDIQGVIDLTQLKEISSHVILQEKMVTVKPIKSLKPPVVVNEPPRDCYNNTQPIVHRVSKDPGLTTSQKIILRKITDLSKNLNSQIFDDKLRDTYDILQRQLSNICGVYESNLSELSRTQTEEFKEDSDNILLNPTETEASHNYMTTEELRRILESPVGGIEDGSDNTQRTVYSLLCPLKPKMSPMSIEEIDTTCDTFITSDSEEVRANLDTAVKKNQMKVVLEVNTKTFPINSEEEEINTYHSNRVLEAPGALSKPLEDRSDDTQMNKTEDLAPKTETSSPPIGFTSDEWKTFLDEVVDNVMKHAKLHDYFQEKQ